MANGLWFRLYVEVAHSRKIQNLPPELFKFWINLMCLAKANAGVLPSLEDMAWTLRCDADQLSEKIGQLRDRRLIDETDTGLVMHDWDEHQYASDGSMARVQKYRRMLQESGSSPHAVAKLRPIILARDGHCAYCGSTEKLVVDHIVPVIRGGWTAEDNLIAACKKCNSGKAGRLPHEAGLKPVSPAFQRHVNQAVTKWSRSVTKKGDRDTCSEQRQSRAETEIENTCIFPKSELPPIAVKSPPNGGKASWKKAKFEEFWSVVWLKKARGNAQPVFERHAKTPEIADQIIAAAKAQGPGILRGAARNGHTPVFPATWLNGQRWLDEEAPLIFESSDLPDTDVYDRQWREERGL